MGNYSRKEILQLVEEKDVEFIRLQFTDMFGVIKNIAVTSRELPRVLDNRCRVDWTLITGECMENETEMFLYPDFDTFAILPWRPQQGKVARFLCDLYCADGTPYKNSSRYILKQNLEKAGEEGYTFFADPECEFFLFHTDDNGIPTTVSHEQAGYLDVSPLDLGENARRDTVLTLEDMGVEVESSDHEKAPAQHEIDFEYDEALATADNIMTFKLTVKTIAKRHGLHATFMPKPLFGVAGNGMHTNMSLFKDGKNAFYDPDEQFGLSTEALQFIAGVLDHAKGITAIANPLVNSYKRLVPGYEAPVYIAWSARNRSPLTRVPAARGNSTRVELRSPDPSCNPYLLLALVLRAGLDGIERGLMPPLPVDGNIYHMSEEERIEKKVGNLPGTLDEAIQDMVNDPLMREALGDHVFNKYVTAKRLEFDKYRVQVHQWEVDRYLTQY